MSPNKWPYHDLRIVLYYYHSYTIINLNNTVSYFLQGYSPLHLAMQFRHENIYKILVEVYGN